MPNDPFGEFLDKKNQDEEQTNNFIDDCKKNWKPSIEALYDQIEQWLEPYKSSHGLSIQEEENYQDHSIWGRTNKLVLKFKNDAVYLTPDGKPYWGAIGAVDIGSSKFKSRILMQRQWNIWEIVDNTYKYQISGGKTNADPIPFTEENFKSTLLELLKQ